MQARQDNDALQAIDRCFFLFSSFSNVPVYLIWSVGQDIKIWTFNIYALRDHYVTQFHNSYIMYNNNVF